MDLRQLAALTAVADHGTFSAAADALHTVQSNVSTHIRRLEHELGVVLVDRSAGRLTGEGEAVVARARRVQAEIDALVADVAALREDVRGSVRLGVISTIARWLVPLLLEAMAERHPGVQLVVVDASTTSLAPQLAAGRLDLALVNLPLPDPDLVADALFDESLVVVAPASHPLAVHDSLAIADLGETRLLLPPVGTALRAELDIAAGRAGVELRPQAELDGVRLTASLVMAGHGAAILPATATSHWLPGQWKRIALTGLSPRRVGLAVRRRGLLAAPAKALDAVVREVVCREAEAQAGVRLCESGSN
jgi:DNA-binding transcriptional LysR family regulator